jgi:hypothetical protein
VAAGEPPQQSEPPPATGGAGRPARAGPSAERGSDEGRLLAAIERAERLLDRLGEQVGYRSYQAGRGLLRLAARAREEAEDMWADARSLRDRTRR